MWVSGEEKGLFGSQAWTEKPWLPEGCKPVCDINIDMIGRNAKHQILITPTAQHAAYNGLTKLAESFFAEEGFTEVKSADEYYQRSDHAMFARLGIPITFLFNDVHADYHKPSDKPEKIDCDKIRRVVRVIVRMLDALQADALDLEIGKKQAASGVK
jgi:Zn-dependent M28 family amino/carboxypeptidase